MKQGKLIRRAVSAALAGCMMFTLSAPALAESTDALMQLSTGSYRSSSLLSEENGSTITVNGKTVDDSNMSDILAGTANEGKLSYNKTTKTLKSSGAIKGDLTINAPGVNIELCNSTSGEAAVSGKLTVTNAQDVKVTAQSYVAVFGDVEISCDGKVEITSGGSPTVAGNVTVKQASTVAISGEWNSYHIVRGDVTIACPAPVVIRNHGTGGMASSIVYSGGKYVYSAAENGPRVDPSSTPINAEANAVYITPVVARTITLTHATVDVPDNKAYAGQTVTVTPDDRTAEGYQFVRWEVVSGIADRELIRSTTDNTATFTMPDEDVELKARYNKLFTVTTNDAKADVTTGIPGTKVTVTADIPEGEKFTGWKVECSDPDFKYDESGETVTFKMPKANVTVTAKHKTKRSVTVNGQFAASGLIEGKSVTVNAEDYGIPAGEFDHWESEQISLTTSEATNSSLTFAMPDEDVVLKAVPKTLYTITVEGGTVNNAVSARVKSGDPVTVVPEDKGADWKFIEWEVIDAPQNFSIDTSNPALQFNMPVGNVTLKAVQMRYRTITVNNGLGQTVKTDALRGETYTFTADKLEGQRFDYWEVTDPDGTRKLMDETINITVPKGNITLTAHYKTLYTITVDGKTIGTAAVGDTVHIKADLPEDRKFSGWKGNVSLNGHEEDSEFDLVITEEKNVELTSVTTQRYYIIIIDANGETKTEAEAGSTYNIKAAGRDGWDFTGWVVDNADVVNQLDLTKADNQGFVMPAGTDVTITATYKKQRTVTVIGGTVNGTNSVTALREETVEIKAEYDPYEKKFDHWEVKGPEGWDLEDDQKTNPEFTLTVPKGNVTLTAVYNDYHNITVEGGYATPDRAIAGTQITLNPNLPDDQEFDYWYSTDINLREDQRGNPNLTFKMRDFDIKITAVPKQLYFVDLEDADTTANGEDTRVEVKTGEEVVLVAPEREGFRFNHWEVTSGTVGLIDADKTTAYFTMKSENVRIKAIYDEYHTITMVDGKGTAYDADGKEITSAVVGDKITIVAHDRDSHEFNRWVIDPDNVILEDPNADKTAFIMPDEPVSVEAKYKHLQSITMNHGTAYDEDFSETDIAKAKQTITIKAEDRYADGLVFDHWAVDTDNVTLADEYGEKTTFEMVNGAVELTAHYKARVTVFSVPAKFEEGIGEHSDETWEKVGETATITAEIDEETFPGMEFDYWEVIPTDLDIGDIHSQTISFEVPECEVKLVAHWKASGMNPIVDPDEDLDPGFDVEPESSDGGAGAAIAGVAIGGAAVWGGYEIATRVILNDLLPAGAAIPANRGQLALLIWTEKGKPEPAAQPAFADITDAELAKAAQWCVEQGLLDAREGKFESDGWMPKFKTIEIWNKAFPKK